MTHGKAEAGVIFTRNMKRISFDFTANRLALRKIDVDAEYFSAWIKRERKIKNFKIFGIL